MDWLDEMKANFIFKNKLFDMVDGIFNILDGWQYFHIIKLLMYLTNEHSLSGTGEWH